MPWCPTQRLNLRFFVCNYPADPRALRLWLWGSTTLRYWASLDPGRPGKSAALILDTGRRVLPFITPDDPGAVQAAIREHSGATSGTGRGVVA